MFYWTPKNKEKNIIHTVTLWHLLIGHKFTGEISVIRGQNTVYDTPNLCIPFEELVKHKFKYFQKTTDDGTEIATLQYWVGALKSM